MDNESESFELSDNDFESEGNEEESNSKSQFNDETFQSDTNKVNKSEENELVEQPKENNGVIPSDTENNIENNPLSRESKPENALKSEDEDIQPSSNNIQPKSPNISPKENPSVNESKFSDSPTKLPTINESKFSEDYAQPNTSNESKINDVTESKFSENITSGFKPVDSDNKMLSSLSDNDNKDKSRKESKEEEDNNNNNEVKPVEEIPPQSTTPKSEGKEDNNEDIKPKSIDKPNTPPPPESKDDGNNEEQCKPIELENPSNIPKSEGKEEENEEPKPIEVEPLPSSSSDEPKSESKEDNEEMKPIEMDKPNYPKSESKEEYNSNNEDEFITPPNTIKSESKDDYISPSNSVKTESPHIDESIFNTENSNINSIKQPSSPQSDSEINTTTTNEPKRTTVIVHLSESKSNNESDEEKDEDEDDRPVNHIVEINPSEEEEEKSNNENKPESNLHVVKNRNDVEDYNDIHMPIDPYIIQQKIKTKIARVHNCLISLQRVKVCKLYGEKNIHFCPANFKIEKEHEQCGMLDVYEGLSGDDKTYRHVAIACKRVQKEIDDLESQLHKIEKEGEEEEGEGETTNKNKISILETEFVNWSIACEKEFPIVLTEKQKDKIDKDLNSNNYTLKYNLNPNKVNETTATQNPIVVKKQKEREKYLNRLYKYHIHKVYWNGLNIDEYNFGLSDLIKWSTIERDKKEQIKRKYIKDKEAEKEKDKNKLFNGWLNNAKRNTRKIPLTLAKSTGIIDDLYLHKLLPQKEILPTKTISAFINDKPLIIGGEDNVNMIKNMKRLDKSLKNYMNERQKESNVHYEQWLNKKSKIQSFLNTLDKIDIKYWNDRIIQNSNVYLLGMALHSLSPQLRDRWINIIKSSKNRITLLGRCMVKRGSYEIVTEDDLSKEIDRGDMIEIDNNKYCVDFRKPREKYRIIISDPYTGRSLTSIPIYKVNIFNDENIYIKMWNSYYMNINVDNERLLDIMRIRNFINGEKEKFNRIKVLGLNNENYRICKYNISEAKKALDRLSEVEDIIFCDLNNKEIDVNKLDNNGEINEDEYRTFSLALKDSVYIDNDEMWYNITKISIYKHSVYLVPSKLRSYGSGKLKFKVYEENDDENNICVWRDKWLYFNELCGMVIRKGTSEVNDNDWFIMPREDDSWTIKYINFVYNTQLQNELLAKEQQYELEKQQMEKDLKELIEKVKRLMLKFPFGRTNTFERSLDVGRLLFAISDSTDFLDTWINWLARSPKWEIDIKANGFTIEDLRELCFEEWWKFNDIKPNLPTGPQAYQTLLKWSKEDQLVDNLIELRKKEREKRLYSDIPELYCNKIGTNTAEICWSYPINVKVEEDKPICWLLELIENKRYIPLFNGYDTIYYMNDLKPNTQYYLRICGVDMENKYRTKYGRMTICTLPLPPSKPVISKFYITKEHKLAEVSWRSNDTGYSLYQLQMRCNDEEGWKIIYEHHTPKTNIYNLVPDTNILLRVRAKNIQNEYGDFSETAMVHIPLETPDPPIAIDIRHNSVLIEWKVPFLSSLTFAQDDWLELVKRKEKCCKILYNLWRKKQLEREMNAMNQWLDYINNKSNKDKMKILSQSQNNGKEWIPHYIKISNREVECFYVNKITKERRWARNRYTDNWKYDECPQHWYDPVTKKCYLWDRNEPSHREWAVGCSMMNSSLENDKPIELIHPNHIKPPFPEENDDDDFDKSYNNKCKDNKYDVFLPDGFILVNGVIQQNKTLVKSIIEYKEGRTGKYKKCYKGSGSGVFIKDLRANTLYKFRLRYYDPVSGVYSMFSKPLCIETPDYPIP